MQPAPHHRRRPASLRKHAILSAAIASLLPALHSPAATVSWAVDSDGTWTTPSNWSTSTLPGPADDVIIDRPDGAYAITLYSSSQSIQSLVDNENLAISSGNVQAVLTVATSAQIGGDMTVSGGSLTMANSLTLAGGTITLLANGSYYSSLYFNGGGTQTFGGTGTVLFGGSSTTDYITSNGGLTIAPGITIATNSLSGTIILGSSSVNQGTISSQINGKNISVTGTNWINAGTLAATNGGTLTLSGSWSNTGTINVGSGSTLGLNGTFTSASLATLVNNGTVSIDGTLNNTGHTVTLDRNSFVLNISDSSTIVGGTVNTTSSGASAYGTMSGVILGGDMVVPNNTTFTITNGLTLAGGSITLSPISSSYSSTLKFSGSGLQTLGGTGTILFGGYGSDSVTVTGSGGLTIAPGVTIATYGNSGSVYIGASGVNQGTISSQSSGKTITIDGTNWINAGTLSASNGGTLTLSGSWSNTGTLTVGTGSKLTLGGTFTLASSGTLNNNGTVTISGTLNNTGKTLTLGGPAFSLAGGTINGGTVNIANGTQATATGTLSGVILGGNLTVPNGTLVVTNGLTLAGGTIKLAPISSTSSLSFGGSSAQTLGGTGTILFDDIYNPYIGSNNGLTIAPGITIANIFSSGSVILGTSGVNRGTISSQINGQSISITGTN